MIRRRETKTVEYNPDGWHLERCDHRHPGIRACGSIIAHTATGQPACLKPAVWRVRTRGRNFQRTGYYCDDDLRDEDRRTLPTLGHHDDGPAVA